MLPFFWQTVTMFGLTNNAKEFQREGPLSTTADAKFIAYAISFWFFGLSLAFSHTHTGRVIFRKDTWEISLTFRELHFPASHADCWLLMYLNYSFPCYFSFPTWPVIFLIKNTSLCFFRFDPWAIAEILFNSRKFSRHISGSRLDNKKW